MYLGNSKLLKSGWGTQRRVLRFWEQPWEPES